MELNFLNFSNSPLILAFVLKINNLIVLLLLPWGFFGRVSNSRATIVGLKAKRNQVCRYVVF